MSIPLTSAVGNHNDRGRITEALKKMNSLIQCSQHFSVLQWFQDIESLRALKKDEGTDHITRESLPRRRESRTLSLDARLREHDT